MNPRVRALICTVLPISLFNSGCATTTSSVNDCNGGRTPASTQVGSYPLNPRFERALDGEDELAKRIKDGILHLQAQAAQKNQGRILRGTHAKGVCVLGTMEIFDTSKLPSYVVPRIKRGIFSQPGTYPTRLRFSNSDGFVNPDSVPDVRSVSFSMQMPTSLSNPQGLMDFTFRDSPSFSINDAQVFADSMTFILNGGDPGALMSLATAKSLGPTLLNFGWRAKSALAGMQEAGQISAAQSRTGNVPYQKLSYWSGVPFALGEDEAVKYMLTPCETNAVGEFNKEDRNALSKELIRHISSQEQMSCFDFQIQLFEPENMRDASGHTWPASYWIENSKIEWRPEQAPFYSVGRLTLSKGSVVEANDCDQWVFDVTQNNNQTHHGLGSINRVRGLAEAASAKRRLGTK